MNLLNGLKVFMKNHWLLLHVPANLDQAIRRRNRAEDTSNVETDKEEEMGRGARNRKRKYSSSAEFDDGKTHP